ncbi:hypothetical protein [Leptospira santarosai]|uniref:hypothetical protein n=1 Tax=Leptospira santarosai TaxID=28183 RepID=UPI0024AEED55|nr:hypothetical protein [Leptospira santarosai]MDI7188088.1 hypothetical protein [Leptospira santarosai]MDI7212576.1 hypothetical protein [Leptospira santarosai]MDI7212767.1 hypothetical protein [Leptospira santarosai]
MRSFSARLSKENITDTILRFVGRFKSVNKSLPLVGRNNKFYDLRILERKFGFRYVNVPFG